MLHKLQRHIVNQALLTPHKLQHHIVNQALLMLHKLQHHNCEPDFTDPTCDTYFSGIFPADIKPEDLLPAEVKDDPENVEMTEQDKADEEKKDVKEEVKGQDKEEVKGQEPPDIDTQKKELQAALKQQLVRGDTWYVRPPPPCCRSY